MPNVPTATDLLKHYGAKLGRQGHELMRSDPSLDVVGLVIDGSTAEGKAILLRMGEQGHDAAATNKVVNCTVERATALEILRELRPAALEMIADRGNSSRRSMPIVAVGRGGVTMGEVDFPA